MKLISNSKDVLFAVKILNEYVLEEDYLSPSLISRGWVVMPVETGMHITEEDIPRLLKAFKNIGCEQCYVIAAERIDIPFCFNMAATKEDLANFQKECGGFKYLMTSEDLKFAILFTTEDYYLIAGDQSFVELALGESVEDATRTFLEYSQQEFWGEKKEFFSRLLEKYDLV